jgi:hypothetical protein
MIQCGSCLIVEQQGALVLDQVDVRYIAARGYGCYLAKRGDALHCW